MTGGILSMEEALEYAETLLDGIALDLRAGEERVVIDLEPDDLPEAARRLRDDGKLSCRYLSCVAGVDNTDSMEAVYILRSLSHQLIVQLTVRLDRADPVVPTVSNIWSGANWHERETYDLFGIRFEGHPDLRRILNREDLDVFPSRKNARPHRKDRPEWRWEGLEPPKRLPGEPPRRERS